MIKKIIKLFILLTFIGCSEAKNDNKYYLLRGMDLNSEELAHSNNTLLTLVKSDTANFRSLRKLSDSIVTELINIKYKLIEVTGGIDPGENIDGVYHPKSFYDFINPNNKAITENYLLTNEHYQAADQIMKLITIYDSHPLVEDPLKDYISKKVKQNKLNKPLENVLFEGATLTEAVEMIELIEKRILFSENIILLNQIKNSVTKLTLSEQQ